MPVIYDVIFHRLLGFLSFDVDVSRLDINQCDSSSTVTPSLEDHSGVFFKIFSISSILDALLKNYL